MLPLIANVASQLAALCRTRQVQQLYLFGSAATGNFQPATSDLDFLVTLQSLPPLERGEALMSLWTELEDLFQRKVDLLTPESLRNPYLVQEIERTKKLIYDAARPEILV
ncbi:nucleotidyltransferase family protein [Hymenobacter cavernae]|uniref:Polymerase beta nucleotidyltransferase domain-containing protein n=1 Tax=Hymenobacter cavernae TaxID=2044852 RepID=A0ABQ1UDQ7_9BACT|nr:nucleotidyltransferase domain-containing protein [Hymenobacter cavernae]GGF13835.1 hypothetical protein GCM10011383_26360 [Hymenobacter cavernae]